MKHQPAPKDDLRERFILFLAGKPADQRYVWIDSCNCACGTFLRENVYWGKVEYGDPEISKAKARAAVWTRWNKVAEQCSTYGELLKRVRET